MRRLVNGPSMCWSRRAKTAQDLGPLPRHIGAPAEAVMSLRTGIHGSVRLGRHRARAVLAQDLDLGNRGIDDPLDAAHRHSR